MANLYIIELPENLGVQADIKRVGATRADNESEAVRNYLFAHLSERSARIVAAKIKNNGGYGRRAHLVPDFESVGMDAYEEGGDMDIHEIRQARHYVFAAELAGGGTPDYVDLRKARRLLKLAGFALD
ncbi:hypothetical protein AUJ84_04655 [Candidatus Pacearchaeota archaeon CG1_02_32_132]|nr:MAG: hypothetical protein AUJ84_04655 [Candidatus Pacearchaeota archaeon CG1_02_32_132]